MLRAVRDDDDVVGKQRIYEGLPLFSGQFMVL